MRVRRLGRRFRELAWLWMGVVLSIFGFADLGTFRSLACWYGTSSWFRVIVDIMVPEGADAYMDELASVIPIANGSVRTALDAGCGVASWGAYLLKRNVLAMS
ncbi:hypothetical protein Droror1_Dr00022043 [Drosera rotundifolia]